MIGRMKWSIPLAGACGAIFRKPKAFASRTGAALCLMSAVLAAPGHALAAADEDEVKHDSRTEGYAKTVQVPLQVVVTSS